MDGGEYQVAGERGLNGDLRRLGVADFADHDFVRVVAQDRAQAARKRQSLFLVDRNLCDAAQLILDRVFNGDDLIFVGLDLVYRGVQRCSLAAARRPRDQHHAVRFLDVAAELAQVVLIKTNHIQGERAELLGHRLFVEHAQHSVFAVNRWLLADRRHRLRQYAVNTELDHHRVVPRLNMNVRSAPLQRSEDRRIDQADDRAGVARRRQLVDGQRLFGAGGLVFANNLEAFAGFLQYALRLLGLLQDVRDLLQRRHFGDDPFLKQQTDLVDHHQLAGIGDRNRQLAVRRLFQRHEVVAEHQLRRELLEQLVVKLKVGEVDKLAAIAPRHVLRALQVGGRIPRRHHLPAEDRQI